MGDQQYINRKGSTSARTVGSDSGTHSGSNSELFLPNLCSTSSVLSLVLVGALLSLALALAADGIDAFGWASFGLISLLVQWVLLLSAATLCAMRSLLSTMRVAWAVSLCYAIVLIYTAVFSFVGGWLVKGLDGFSWYNVFTNVLIAAIFSGVLFRYLYLQQRLKHQERAELSARLQALQSRIRPHFLFNSLNSIASLITIKPELAEKLVVDLAQLFRASLQAQQLIPITQELDLCYRFCNIEKVRLGQRLDMLWQVEDLPNECQIPSLLLQPLVENAIYHGIQPLPKGGRVVVDVKTVKGDVVLHITNPRLSGSEHEGHRPEGSVSGNGIALSNIRDRLSALYGKSAYLRVVKGEADFSVVVRYPIDVKA